MIQSSAAKHTPTPWRFQPSGWEPKYNECVYRIERAYDCAPIATVSAVYDRGVLKEESQANAALIVRAVNCHDELIAELQRAHDTIGVLIAHLHNRPRMLTDAETDLFSRGLASHDSTRRAILAKVQA